MVITSNFTYNKYIKFNPVERGFYLMLEVGEVSSNSIMMTLAQFFDIGVDREWVKPQGWIDNVFANPRQINDQHRRIQRF